MLNRTLLLIMSLFTILGLLACQTDTAFKYDADTALQASLQKMAAYPQANFIVFSDPHLYDDALGTKGKAFEDYLASDRKLLIESEEIMQSMVASVKDVKADFVLVSGDLTKDGELDCHQLFSKYLKQIRDSGKKVYVIPGNHDINNGQSEKYVGDSAQRVPNITAEQFRQIYNDFGFSDAIERDTDSLSYLAEPMPGLWLLALDSCRYRDNVEGKEETVDGRFSAITMKWIENELIKAAQQNKAVIVMMHHGVLEHFTGETKTFGEYVIENNEFVSRMFADYNVRMVFTGHFHAQDITERTLPQTNKFIFDVETGSLTAYPCPYRVIQITSDQQAVIRSHSITSIKSHPVDLQQYAKDYLHQGIAGIAAKAMTGLGVSKEEAKTLSGQIADALASHYGGDEKLASDQVPLQEQGLSPMGWLFVHFYKPGLVAALWKDLPPPDNNVTLNLATGTWQEP